MAPKCLQIHVFELKRRQGSPWGATRTHCAIATAFRCLSEKYNFSKFFGPPRKRAKNNPVKYRSRGVFLACAPLGDCPLPPWNPPSRQGSRKRHLQLRLKPASGIKKISKSMGQNKSQPVKMTRWDVLPSIKKRNEL